MIHQVRVDAVVQAEVYEARLAPVGVEAAGGAVVAADPLGVVAGAPRWVHSSRSGEAHRCAAPRWAAGPSGERKWVFWSAYSTCLVGSFDGCTFHREQGARKVQPDGYAAQTWSVPPEDGRRLEIAWLRQQMPGMPFGQYMTILHSLGMQRCGDQVLLTAAPVRELERLRMERWEIADTDGGAATIVAGIILAAVGVRGAAGGRPRQHRARLRSAWPV